jgi:uncharacterized alkaline shock family protein YloU
MTAPVTSAAPDGPELHIGRSVVREVVRLATLEIPGVLRIGRGGPFWRDWLGGPPISSRFRDDGVHLKIWVVARPGGDLAGLAADVRSTVGATVERLLGLRLGSVTVLVDGVGS